MSKRRGRFFCAGSAASFGVVALLLRAFWPPGPVDIVYSTQTTYLLGPLNPDGTVDYRSVVEKDLSDGVTPENNAAIPLIRALGPLCLGARTRGAALDALGLARLPEEGEYLVELKDHARTHGLDATEAKAMEYPLLDEWLEVNRRPLEAVVEASRRPRFYCPHISRSVPQRLYDAAVLDGPRSLRVLQVPLGCRARRRLAAGDLEGAWSDALTLVRLGYLITQDMAIITHIIGCGMAESGAEIFAGIATRGRLGAAQARRFLADLSSLPAPLEVADLFLFERFIELDVAVIIARDGAEGAPCDVAARGLDTGALDPNVILRQTNALFDLQVSALKTGSLASQLDALAAESSRLLGMLRGLVEEAKKPVQWRHFLASAAGRRELRSERIAKILVGQVLSHSEPVVRSRAAAAARIDLARVALALTAFKAARGVYPASPSELVPAQLPQLPTDLFTDKALGYRREGGGYVLWSVGRDRKDDGGIAQDNKDLVVRGE